MRKLVYIALATSLVASVLLFQNCNGLRIRSSDFSITAAQVMEKVNALYSNQQAMATLDASAVADFFDLANQPNSTIYYAEAPSIMGSIDTVLPLDFGSFNVTTKPSGAAAYLAYGMAADGPRAALLITEIKKDESGALFESPIIVLSSGQPGSMTETDIDLPMIFNGNLNLILRSQDIVDGDLAAVVQFEVIEPIDSESEYTLGLINLVQAE